MSRRPYSSPVAGAIILLLAVAEASFAQGVLQSVGYQQGPTHEGLALNAGIGLPLRQRWVLDLPGLASYPVIAEGKVFVAYTVDEGDGATFVVALSALDGSTVWGPSMLENTYGSAYACYEAGTLFAMSHDGRLTAFDASTGSVKWTIDIPYQEYFWGPPNAYGGTLFVSGAQSGGTVYAIDEQDGHVIWFVPLNSGDNSSPAVDDTGVYASFACIKAYRFNRLTGALEWETLPPCEGGGGATPVLHDRRLYARDVFDRREILDASTGETLGTHLSRRIPAFSGNSGLYMEQPNPFLEPCRLLNVNLATEAITWTFEGDGQLTSAPLVVDSYVLVGSVLGNLYAVDLASGQILWTTNVGKRFLPGIDTFGGNPTPGFGAGEGIVVVPASNRIIAFEPANGQATVDCPDDVLVQANASVAGTRGAYVSFPLPTTTGFCTPPTVTCTPTVGSFFAVGSTSVTCVARDTCGGADQCSFVVSVTAPPSVCLIDDATGNRFVEVVDSTNPLYGFWSCTLTATGEVLYGRAETLRYVPGRSLASSDRDNPSMSATAVLSGTGRGTASIVDRVSGRRVVVRDSNLSNDGTCE